MSNHNDNPGYRVISEMTKMHDIGEMFHTLRTQGEDLKELKDEMHILAKLATAVELMAQKMDSLLEHNTHVQELRTKVSIHQTLVTLFGTMCLAFMPLVMAWNYSLQNEIKALGNQQIRQTEKVAQLAIIVKQPQQP